MRHALALDVKAYRNPYRNPSSWRTTDYIRFVEAPRHLAVRCQPPKADPLQELYDAVQASQKILSLPDDWDDEGSPHIAESTWKRATDYLVRHAKMLYTRNVTRLPIPRILPGPDGSVDLHWRTENRELLVNIPAKMEEPAAFYGDGVGTNSIKGQLDTSAADLGLIKWLIAME